MAFAVKSKNSSVIAGSHQANMPTFNFKIFWQRPAKKIKSELNHVSQVALTCRQKFGAEMLEENLNRKIKELIEANWF